MNKEQQVNSGSSAALGFVLGALVGAGIALLAPRTGKETRQRLVDAGARWSDEARGKLDQAREIAHDLKKDAKSAVDAGREAFERGQNSRESRPAARTELKTELKA